MINKNEGFKRFHNLANLNDNHFVFLSIGVLDKNGKYNHGFDLYGFYLIGNQTKKYSTKDHFFIAGTESTIKSLISIFNSKFEVFGFQDVHETILDSFKGYKDDITLKTCTGIRLLNNLNYGHIEIRGKEYTEDFKRLPIDVVNQLKGLFILDKPIEEILNSHNLQLNLITEEKFNSIISPNDVYQKIKGLPISVKKVDNSTYRKPKEKMMGR